MSGDDNDPLPTWLFAGAAGLMALCADADGDPLPEEHGPWTRVRKLMLDHADEEEARRLIREHGFCCFDAAIEDVS